jgi:hypothetical protein
MRLTLASFVVAMATGMFFSGPALAGSRVSVHVDRTEISTKLGHTFLFHSTITNEGPVRISGLIAHLNVFSYDPGTYVDPEDWSSHRTLYLASLASRASRTLTWKMQAVNDGSFGVYVAAVARAGAPGAPATGPAIRVDVAKRTTLNAQGIVPLALGIPAALGLLTLGLRFRRRRR